MKLRKISRKKMKMGKVSQIKKFKELGGEVVEGVDGAEYLVEGENIWRYRPLSIFETYRNFISRKFESNGLYFLVTFVAMMTVSLLVMLGLWGAGVISATSNIAPLYTVLIGSSIVLPAVSNFVMSKTKSMTDEIFKTYPAYIPLLKNKVTAPVAVTLIEDKEIFAKLKRIADAASKVVSVAEKVGGDAEDHSVSAVRALLRQLPENNEAVANVNKDLSELHVKLDEILKKRVRREEALAIEAKLEEDKMILAQSAFVGEQITKALEATDAVFDLEAEEFLELDAKIADEDKRQDMERKFRSEEIRRVNKRWSYDEHKGVTSS